MADGVSKCGRKTALSIFFGCSVIGFLFCLLSLLSPSWQYVYLENGRTEHHHGLWLDCKRDYSYDYGRPREYYETLWRRDLEGSPFAVFFLPPLNCVYKFDYYIDPEDLYDHDHDENRIQNDAYQHLFLGWKVAALSGVGVAVCFCISALLLGICSFCHRTFICACTVLITIAAFLSTAGWVVFYMWANYQDNKVIKEEEDTIYEQKLGWAFYFQIVGSIILWFSSMLGCCVTSISLGKARGAKLVKIEVLEGDDSVPLNGTHSSQPFKRSFSAIYRVDSSALRQWEKDYLKKAREQALVSEGNFKRTASMPNFSKKQQKQERKRVRQLARNSQDFFSSTSNITEMTHASNLTLSTQQTAATAPAPLLPLDPSTPKLKSALKTPKSSRKNLNDTDPTYDYLACPSSAGVSSFLGINSLPKPHVYDPVYEQIGPAQEYYLEPNSVKEGRSTLTLNKDSPTKALLPSLPVTGSSQSIPVQQKTTVIDDVVRPVSWQSDQKKNAQTQAETRKVHERRTIEEMTRLERFKKMSRPAEPPPKPAMNIRDFGIDINKQSVGIAEITKDLLNDPKLSPLKYASLINTGNDSEPVPSSSPQRYTQEDTRHRMETSIDDLPDPPPGIALNTFGMEGRASQRSITNLSFHPGSSSVLDVFERPDSSASSRPNGKSQEKKTAVNLHRQLFTSLPDEVDRSVGSSTQYENDTMSETASYVKDANIRLNLFLNEKTAKQDETTV